jgi:YHS domain-containing protein
MRKFIITVASALALTAVATAGEIVNTDKSGLALHGYDPVAYFTDKKPVEGKPAFTATYKGTRYQFASAEHKELFEKNPAKYAPQYGGFCGYAVSINKTADINPHFWQVLDGRLVLQHGQKAWNLWIRDVSGNLEKADANWPKLKNKKRG